MATIQEVVQGAGVMVDQATINGGSRKQTRATRQNCDTILRIQSWVILSLYVLSSIVLIILLSNITAYCLCLLTHTLLLKKRHLCLL